MMRWMCKSKIHRATVTEADLAYEGSIAVDETLLEAADIVPSEMVQVFNINNGQRFETYAIPGPKGSGVLFCAEESEHTGRAIRTFTCLMIRRGAQGRARALAPACAAFASSLL